MGVTLPASKHGINTSPEAKKILFFVELSLPQEKMGLLS